MKTEHIEVVDYDSKWVNDFNQIKGEIEEALKDLVLVVEHVGSTSVPLLAAKPIIDLDVVIDQNDLKEVIYLSDKYANSENNIASRRLFDKCGIKYSKIDIEGSKKIEIEL